jgi:RimJ/RimL family protein N-acetyltransferase
MEDDESADSRNSEDPVQDPVERRAEISAAAANRRSGRKHSRSGMYGGGEARELRREQDRKRPAKLRDDSSDVE